MVQPIRSIARSLLVPATLAAVALLHHGLAAQHDPAGEPQRRHEFILFRLYLRGYGQRLRFIFPLGKPVAEHI